MDQKEACAEVKKMLEEIDKLAPRFIELHKDLDSLDNLDEIGALFLQLKKTLQDNSELRQNLKTWERRSKKIQRIDEIAKKLKRNKEANLSIDELHALYKQAVRGFYGSSPFNFSTQKHAETISLIQKRQIEGKTKEDYARIYGCRPEQITSKPDDVFKENSDIVVFIGVRLDFTNQELPKTLKHVSGNLQSDSKNAKLPKKLEYVGGYLELRSLTSAKGLVLPETVGGSLDLDSLTSAKGLVLPETVGEYLNLSSLESAKGLALPKTIGGNLVLDSLTSAEGLVLPKTIGGYLILDSLTSAEGLEKLNYASITGGIYLPKAFSNKDKEKVEKIKIEQAKKGINVNFTY